MARHVALQSRSSETAVSSNGQIRVTAKGLSTTECRLMASSLSVLVGQGMLRLR